MFCVYNTLHWQSCFSPIESHTHLHYCIKIREHDTFRFKTNRNITNYGKFHLIFVLLFIFATLRDTYLRVTLDRLVPRKFLFVIINGKYKLLKVIDPWRLCCMSPIERVQVTNGIWNFLNLILQLNLTYILLVYLWKSFFGRLSSLYGKY